MSRPVNIDIKTTADTTGAKSAEQALDKIKQSAGGAGAAGSQANQAMDSGLGAIAGKLLTVGAAWLAVRRAIAGVSEAMRLAGEQEALDAKQEAIIKATGAAAGYTGAQLKTLRDALSELTSVSDEAIEHSQNLLLTFTNIRDKKVFEGATESILDLAAVMGGDASGAAIMLGKALNDPAVGLTYLRRAGISFNDEQTKTIIGLAQTGDLFKAQSLILAEVQRQFGGAAKAAGETLAGALGRASNAAGDAKQAFGSLFGEFLRGSGLLGAYTDGMRGLEAAFQRTSTVAEMLKMSLPDLANVDFSAIAADAARLAGSLEDAGKAAEELLTRQKELEQAKLARDIAEVKRDVATGRISTEEGQGRIAGLQAGADQRMIAAEKEAIAAERDRLQQQITAADEQQTRAAGGVPEHYNALVTQLRQLFGGMSESEAAVVASGNQRGTEAVLRARASQSDVDLEQAKTEHRIWDLPETEAALNAIKERTEKEKEAIGKYQELIAAYNSALAGAQAQIVAAEKTKTGAMSGIAALTHREQVLDIAGQASSYTAEAGTADASNAAAVKQAREEAARIREQMRELEKQKRETERTAPARFGVERERAEAAAAEGAVATAKRTGRAGGREIGRRSGAAALAELEAAAAREKDEYLRAVANATNAIGGIANAIQDLANRLAQLEAQIKNGPS